jgi:hypothetical protein
LTFDYYYGAEAEQFSFYRIPRLLIKDKQFKGLSSDAKLLYGLMLDRMSLSIKNEWFDEKSRVYIIYTIDNIREDLGCSKEKAVKVVAELDADKGIGLVEKIRRGLGQPDIIYIKNFITSDEDKKEPSNADISTEVGKTDPNYTDYNYTDMNYNNPINQSEKNIVDDMLVNEKDDRIDEIDETKIYMELIRDNLEYEHHMKYDQRGEREMYEEIYEIICDVVCVKREEIRINGEDYPYELVKSRFLKLNSSHIEYVMRRMKDTVTKVFNIRAYLITTLYNAPSTMNYYYQQEVQHDMYSGYG